MSDSVQKVVLSGDQTIENAKEARDAIIGALGKSREVEVVVKDCNYADFAFMQLLLSANATAVRDEKKLDVNMSPNVEFIKMAQELGIQTPEGDLQWPW